MALNLQRTSTVSLAVDNPASRFVGNLTKSIQDTLSYTGGVSAEVSLAAGSQSLNMLGVAAGHFLYLEFDVNMTITIAANTFSLEKPANSPTGIFMATFQAFTAVTVNPSATVNLGYIIAGAAT